MAACKVVFMSPRRSGLGPSAILVTRDMRSINYVDYPAGTRLSAAEKKRVTKQLMKGCKELSRRRGGFRDGVPAAAPAPAASKPTAPAAAPVAGWWPFRKKATKKLPTRSAQDGATVMYIPSPSGRMNQVMRGAKRKRRRR